VNSAPGNTVTSTSTLPASPLGFRPKYIRERSGEAVATTETAVEPRTAPDRSVPPSTITGRTSPSEYSMRPPQYAPPSAPAVPPEAAPQQPPVSAAVPEPPATTLQPPPATPPSEPAAEPPVAAETSPWVIAPAPGAPPAEPSYHMESSAPRAARPKLSPLVLAAIVIGVLALAGIGYYFFAKPGKAPQTASAPAAPGAPQAFRVCGSFSMMDRLAPELVRGFLTKMGASSIASRDGEFSGQLPGVSGTTRIGMATMESNEAFRSLANGSCQIAITGQQMNASDRTGSKIPISESVLAMDGVVIVAHPSNPVTQLSLDQVEKIFTGAISNWSAVGGGNVPIEIILPNDNTDEMSSFRLLVLKNAGVSGSSRRVGTLPDVSATVGHDRNAIGVVGFNGSDPARVLRLTANDGSPIVASSLTIGQKRYPLTMPVYLYDAAQKADPLASKFVAFTQSESGQAIVTGSNFVGRNSF
jgi:phosphate transport system substrate-binding protein